MAVTPRHVIKCTVYRKAHTLGYACAAYAHAPEPHVFSERTFTGRNGHAVRKDAIAWVHEEAERLAKANNTAWQDVYQSRRAPHAYA